jgi:hypothetical protein
MKRTWLETFLFLEVIFLILLLALPGCMFQKDNEPVDPVHEEMLENIEAKQAIYIRLAPGDEYGFTHRGDGLSFACLKHASGAPVLWQEAEIESGRYQRHPTLEYPGESASTMSKDMALGLMYCIWKDQDLGAIERFIRYLERNDWDLCGGRDNAESESVWLGRCKVTPALKATFYELRFRMGGDDHPARKVPQLWDPWSSDFRTHLTVLHILLRGDIQGGINDLQVDFLKAKARNNPQNALYQAAYHRFTDGWQHDAARLLLDEDRFPAERLPTGENHCSPYLYERDDDNDGYTPCPDEKEPWPSVDWLFAAWTTLGMQW